MKETTLVPGALKAGVSGFSRTYGYTRQN